MKTFTNRALLRATAAPMILGVALLSSTAFAQEAPAEDDGDTIIVTGSRIAQTEFETANPIVAISAEDLEKRGIVNAADFLISNPALTASRGSSLAGQADAGFGETGANFLDLRNLGENRTLVLVNGKRHVAGIPNSAAVDINSIPTDLIEKIDVLTGGASAIYGADGVSGVVNFVLKRDYEGVALRAQAGLSGEGDAGQQFISLVAGQNFLDDRANVTIAYEFSNSERLSSFDRDFTGDPLKNFGLFRDINDFPDDPNVPDRKVYNNITWADSSPDGAVDLDLDFVPDFTGSGLPYDQGLILRSAGGRAIGGSNTPTAGYFGDLLPEVRRHAGNILTAFEVSTALKFYAEGKYVRTDAYSVGQPAFDFYTYLQPDNAYLAQRFGANAAPGGALFSRDHLDLGLRGETVKRETYRGVIGAEGEIGDNLKYDVSYVYGRTTAETRLTSNLIRDRYYAALDAVDEGFFNTGVANGNIVCRSTLDPTAPANDSNFGGALTTFTAGPNSICRPLNMLGIGVQSQAALDFVLADNVTKSRITQNVVSGSITGDTGSFFELPGGAIDFALGAEYRKETSLDTPDALIQSGDLRDFSQGSASQGEFDVKEVFAEVRVPLLADMPFAELLSVSAAIRLSDYSTVGTTETWKVDGVYAPIPDVRFRATYSQAVRAPNIGELFSNSSGTFAFVTDPCDVTRLNDGTQFRTANCATILAGLGLSPTQIANFSPSTDAQATTSRRGVSGGNPNLIEETAKTWTAGVVLQPRFVPGLTISFDWYNIEIEDAVNTPTATELAELCVDQPTVDNVFCDNIFRAAGTGFVLGDGNDTQQRIGFRVGPQNVANFKTSGADFAVRYSFSPADTLGRVSVALTGGYLDKITFIPSIGADVDDDYLEQYNPKWRGSLAVGWELGKVALDYNFSYWSKTRRFTTEQLTGNPDLSDPKYFFFKEQGLHDIRGRISPTDTLDIYAGVNNLTNQKPDFTSLSYPVSAVGRYFYLGLKAKLK